MTVRVFAPAHHWSDYNLLAINTVASQTPYAGHRTLHESNPGTLQQTFIISPPANRDSITIYPPADEGPL